MRVPSGAFAVILVQEPLSEGGGRHWVHLRLQLLRLVISLRSCGLLCKMTALSEI